MPVHSIHIFDRKGNTLFTRRFVKDASPEADAEALSDQRKLVFGMVFSLREIVASLSPQQQPQQSKSDDGGLHSVQTGASTLYSYETPSGLRLALYMTPQGGGEASGTTSTAATSSAQQLQQQQHHQLQQQASLQKQQQRAKSIRLALKHIYHELWIQCVTRSPLYTPTNPNVEETNFGQRLEAFLKAQSWYK